MTHEVHIPVPGLTHPIKPAGVVIIDGETGEALPASALFGVTLAELLASVLPVAPNVTRGGGALDANTQRVTLATDGPGVTSLSSIDNKTPALVSGAGPVIATPRICLGSFCFSATTTSRSLTDLVATDSAGVIPAGAVTCELQADGGTIRIGRFAGKPATSSSGYRLDDGAEKMIDTAFSAVTIAAASTVPVNCAFFDRV